MNFQPKLKEVEMKNMVKTYVRRWLLAFVLQDICLQQK